MRPCPAVPSANRSSTPVRPRRSARLVCVAGAFATALLGSCSKSSDPPTNAIQQYVVVKGVSYNLGRLIDFVSAAEQGMQTLAQQRPGSPQARSFLSGARTGWNNVLVQTTDFTPTQAGVVPGLAAAVLASKEAATHWLTGLSSVSKQVTSGSVGSFDPLWKKFTRARTDEAKARTALAAATATLAGMACSLETSHPELAPSATKAADCSTASTLAAASP